MFIRLSALVACICMAWPQTGSAQALTDEDDLALVYGDKSTISLATGRKQHLRTAPSVGTVITAEDIAAMGAVDIDEVLETVPGVHVSRTGIRYAPTYFVRGMVGSLHTTPQLLILQNGVPLTTSYNGDKGADWTMVPIDNISRIEVIRGPGSALYGADAYSGVINVITKSAQEVGGAEAGMRAGSFGTWSTWTQYGGKVGAIDAAAYLRVGGSGGGGGLIASDAQTANDKKFGTHASLAPGNLNNGYEAIDASLNLTLDKWTAHAGYRKRDHMGDGAGTMSALVPSSSMVVEHFVGDISWTDPRISDYWGLGFTAAYATYAFTFPNNLTLLPAGAVTAGGTFPDGMIGGPNQWEKQLRLSGQATYSGVADHRLRFGFGRDDLNLYQIKTINNFILNSNGVPVPTGAVSDHTNIQPHISPQQRQVTFLSAQDEWSFHKDWALTAGVRHDKYSDFGTSTNPRVALVWDVSLDWTAKILYGHAFRAPTFNEHYGKNPVANGNSNLKPETVRTLEAAVSWQASNDINLNLNVFRFEMQDMIRLVSNASPATGSTYQNMGSQSGSGFELEGVWNFSRDLRLSSSYSNQKSIDNQTGQNSGYAPHHHLYERADWRFRQGWLASGQINYVADRKRAPRDKRSQISDYTTLDLTLRTDRGRNAWNYSASIRNAFNALALEPTPAPGTDLPGDLPIAPRMFYLQASYAL